MRWAIISPMALNQHCTSAQATHWPLTFFLTQLSDVSFYYLLHWLTQAIALNRATGKISVGGTQPPRQPQRFPPPGIHTLVVSSNTVSGLVCVTNKYGISNNTWCPKPDPRRLGSLWESSCHVLTHSSNPMERSSSWGTILEMGPPASHFNYNLLRDRSQTTLLNKSLP